MEHDVRFNTAKTHLVCICRGAELEIPQDIDVQAPADQLPDEFVRAVGLWWVRHLVSSQ